MVLASEGIFALRYPDDPVTEALRALTAAILAVGSKG